MSVAVTYRGRAVSSEDVAFIRRLIAAHPGSSRRALSQELCRAWGWKQPNGALCDMVCRGLLLALERAGRIELPPQRQRPLNPLAERKKPSVARLVHVDRTPLHAKLQEIRPLEFRSVRRTADEPLFNALIEAHHYLGYTQPVGAHLKYLVTALGRPVACVVWSSPPFQLGCRDRFIGWSAEARRRNLHLIAYNPRFLILPWIFVPHLASHILGRMTRMLPGEWQRVYGHPVHFVETFVDPERFRGTCYRAANWQVLGHTSGRGKDAPTKCRTRPIKAVLGYPLTRRFRELLAEG